jgi:hypothetical protein
MAQTVDRWGTQLQAWSKAVTRVGRKVIKWLQPTLDGFQCRSSL